MVRELERAGVQHFELPLASKNPFVMRANIDKIAALIERERIDIVHARSRAPAWSAFAAARRTRRIFLTTFHNAYGAGSWFKRRYNDVMARGELVIAISHFVAEHAAKTYGIPPERLRIIERGVDLERFNPERVSAERIIQLARAWRLPDGVPVIMLPGRLTRWKGQFVLIEAIARLGRTDIRCLLVGAGDRSYRKALEARIAALRLGALFQIVDDCPDMPAAYMLADVVVSASSRPEGFGRVIAEGLAMGRPVIATDHGGAREIIEPHQTGWLIPPDDPDALAAALNEALALGPAGRQSLAALASSRMRERFSSELMTQRTIEVYEELLRSAGAARAQRNSRGKI